MDVILNIVKILYKNIKTPYEFLILYEFKLHIRKSLDYPNSLDLLGIEYAWFIEIFVIFNVAW